MVPVAVAWWTVAHGPTRHVPAGTTGDEASFEIGLIARGMKRIGAVEGAALIFDGECGLCRRRVEHVRLWDREGRIEMVPYQTPDLVQRFPSVSRDECVHGIHLVEKSGVVHRGAAAGREVLRRLPAGWLWKIPSWIPGEVWTAEYIYVWIAHRWGPLRVGRKRDVPHG